MDLELTITTGARWRETNSTFSSINTSGSTQLWHRLLATFSAGKVSLHLKTRVSKKYCLFLIIYLENHHFSNQSWIRSLKIRMSPLLGSDSQWQDCMVLKKSSKIKFTLWSLPWFRQVDSCKQNLQWAPMSTFSKINHLNQSGTQSNLMRKWTTWASQERTNLESCSRWRLIILIWRSRRLFKVLDGRICRCSVLWRTKTNLTVSSRIRD